MGRTKKLARKLPRHGVSQTIAQPWWQRVDAEGSVVGVDDLESDSDVEQAERQHHQQHCRPPGDTSMYGPPQPCPPLVGGYARPPPAPAPPPDGEHHQQKVRPRLHPAHAAAPAAFSEASVDAADGDDESPGRARGGDERMRGEQAAAGARAEAGAGGRDGRIARGEETEERRGIGDPEEEGPEEEERPSTSTAEVRPAPEVGPGWTVRITARASRDAAGRVRRDRVWSDPGNVRGFRFKSLAECRAYAAALPTGPLSAGDGGRTEEELEELAWEGVMEIRRSKKRKRRMKAIHTTTESKAEAGKAGGAGRGQKTTAASAAGAAAIGDASAADGAGADGAPVPAAPSGAKKGEWEPPAAKERPSSSHSTAQDGCTANAATGRHQPKLTRSVAPRCRVAGCEKQSQGWRYAYKCARHYRLGCEEAAAGIRPKAKAKAKGSNKKRGAASGGIGGGRSAKAAKKATAKSKARATSSAPSPRKRSKTTAKARREERTREAAEEEGRISEGGGFHAAMLRAVNDAPNDYAAALAEAAFKAAGGDEWLRDQMKKKTQSMEKLGMFSDSVAAAQQQQKPEASTAAPIVVEGSKALPVLGESKAVEGMSVRPPPSDDGIVEDTTLWEWSDEKQMNYRAVQRISVHDPAAREIVTDARLNGTPVVITGHVGWAGFAKRWLRKTHNAVSSIDDQCIFSLTEGEEKKVDFSDRLAGPCLSAETALLDLSDPSLFLDVDAMADDIGQEEVPVIRKSYDDTAPIHGTIPLRMFLQTNWPSRDQNDDRERNDLASPKTHTKKDSSLYLHQWQFPLSETAVPKLCRQSTALPNNIFGEDLYRYWLDRCPGDCPLQYLFMGNTDTMSKLHKDPGGLAITIAPIVGEKECVLVHRDDSTCLYHLEADVDPQEIDLDAYPLLAQARIWRTTIKPGEILLMPQGTYHQCRNVTPCLSYSRFHLDTVNLQPYLQSLFDGTAEELVHDEVLWNAVDALMKKVDKVTDAGQDVVKMAMEEGRNLLIKPDDMRVSEEIARAVEALRCLRHIIREMARKLDVREAVKGPKADEMPGPSSRSAKIDGTKDVWFIMVEDIDYCLHEFRYRFSRDVPKLSHRRPKGKKRFAMPSSLMRAKKDKDANVTVFNGYQRVDNDDNGNPILAFCTNLERAYILLSKSPPALPEAERKALNEQILELSIGDEITARIQNKKCPATVTDIKNQYMLYLTYEDLPALYDEYLPADLVRDTYCGKAEVPLRDLKPGTVVIGLVGEKRDEYRAIVKQIKYDTFFKAKMNVLGGDEIERWIDASGILGIGGPKKRTRKKRVESSEEEEASEEDQKENGSTVANETQHSVC